MSIALRQTISMYGHPLSLWFFLLAFQGCIDLIRKKYFMLISLFLFWSSYLLIYVLLVFQGTHLLFPFPIVFSLASIGLSSIVAIPNNQKYLWSAAIVFIVLLNIYLE